MSAPKTSDLRKLRRLGKYLIGRPRLVMQFKWQDMPSTITAFTDSDWAGCAQTAKSTSGGVLCLGEHVIRTYSKQQKVVALSSAEAELYAMVAASAETLGLQAYARDLGIELSCELYCDSAAALGIAQRAGIGKVRHLRTQGLWVQEVRVSGRIAYHKVLGEKNPADLLTKFMTAELASKHLSTLNMKMTEGRAESAPSLSSVGIDKSSDGRLIMSVVHGWYEDSTTNRKVDKAVRFDTLIRYRGIPAEGRMLKTPERGKARAKWVAAKKQVATTMEIDEEATEDDVASIATDKRDEAANKKIPKGDEIQEEIRDAQHEGPEMKMHENLVEKWQEMQRSRPRWADICEDPDSCDERMVMSLEWDRRQSGRARNEQVDGEKDIEDHRCRLMSSAVIEPQPGSEDWGDHHHGDDDELYSCDSFSFSFSGRRCANRLTAGVSKPRIGRRADGASGRANRDDRLSGRHLEAGCPVPTIRRRTEFARRMTLFRHKQPSASGIGRRRSVGSVCHEHVSAGAHVQLGTRTCSAPCVCALLCSHTRMEESYAHTFFRCAVAQAALS